MKTKTEGKHKEPCPQCGSVAPETRGALTTPLIAAAPELLEAAKAGYECLRHWHDYGHEPTQGELEHEMETLQAAIAKATGGK